MSFPTACLRPKKKPYRVENEWRNPEKKEWRERCAACLTRDCASTRCPGLRPISQVRPVRSYDRIHLYMTSWIAWFWQFFHEFWGFFENWNSIFPRQISLKGFSVRKSISPMDSPGTSHDLASQKEIASVSVDVNAAVAGGNSALSTKARYDERMKKLRELHVKRVSLLEIGGKCGEWQNARFDGVSV